MEEDRAFYKVDVLVHYLPLKFTEIVYAKSAKEAERLAKRLVEDIHYNNTELMHFEGIEKMEITNWTKISTYYEHR